jgi:small subunit ribosomal protein S4
MKIGPRYKIARRLGADVFDKTQTQKFSVREARKAQKTSKRPRPMTEYGTQMIQKQKVRFMYGITEKQFSKYVFQSVGKSGISPSDKLFEKLETRLDNAVYRLGLAPSRSASRQMTSHGHILVNGKRVNIPSYALSLGDKISIRVGSLASPLFKDLESIDKKESVVWMKSIVGKKEWEIVGMPKYSPTDSTIDLGSVIEFYSR